MRFERCLQIFTFPSPQTFCKVNKSTKKYQVWNKNKNDIFWEGETRQKN